MWNPDDVKTLKRLKEQERLIVLQRQRESVEVAARKALIQKLKASRKHERSHVGYQSSAFGGSSVYSRSRDDFADRYTPRHVESVKSGTLLRSANDARAVNSIRSGLIAALGKRT